VLDGHGLGDHPAHRHAEHVGPVDAEGVEHGDGVGGHVGQQVGHRRRLARGQRLPHGPHVDRLAHVRRQPGVAVVEAHDVHAPVDERGAEVGAPADHLAAEPVDQQQRRVGRIPERLVVDLDPGARGNRHGGHRVAD
jgi:hypothetical protein